MKKHLEQLPHQEDAIKAIMDAMQGCRDIDNNTDVYANPIINLLYLFRHWRLKKALNRL